MRFLPLIAFGFGLLFTSGMARGDEGTDFFEKKVRPLLVEHCLECHGPEKHKGGLRWDSREGWQTGGD
ncbi:MAG: Planctomycete cytochrome, partial [Verrucomicrobiaceae bacterium]|nr:Planctomycete cytochrome [Verrucomicrobiaceae bacterium]